MHPSGSGARKAKGPPLGTVTIAGELVGRDELEELWKLDASENAPEEDDGEDDDTDTDVDEDDEDGGEPFKPKDIPHG
jgi:hypothetical protein